MRATEIAKDHRTYDALLEAIKAHARFIRRGNSKKSVAYWAGNALLKWACAYEVAGPRPIESEYPPSTTENVYEIDALMKQHRADFREWEAKVEAALGEAFFDSVME